MLVLPSSLGVCIDGLYSGVLSPPLGITNLLENRAPRPFQLSEEGS